MRARPAILFLWALAGIIAGMGSSPVQAGRTIRGLQALYDFSSPSGSLVRDRSGLDPAIDLKLRDPGKGERSKGSLQIHKPTILASTQKQGVAYLN